MEIGTLLQRRLTTSVRVGDLLIPVESLSRHFRRYTDPALFHTDGMGEFHLSKSGSLGRVKIGNRYFGVTSYHQIGDYGFNQLCALEADRRTLVSSHRAIYPSGDQSNSDDFDCAVFEFTEAVEAGYLSRDIWFDGSADRRQATDGENFIYVCVGYPGCRANLDVDAMSFSSAPNAVWGLPVPARISGRMTFVPNPTIEFEPSGMSGAPIFGIYLDAMEVKSCLAGILTNASTSAFNFLPFNRIADAIAQY